jgi:hypothetical protein
MPFARAVASREQVDVEVVRDMIGREEMVQEATCATRLLGQIGHFIRQIGCPVEGQARSRKELGQIRHCDPGSAVATPFSPRAFRGRTWENHL